MGQQIGQYAIKQNEERMFVIEELFVSWIKRITGLICMIIIDTRVENKIMTVSEMLPSIQALRADMETRMFANLNTDENYTTTMFARNCAHGIVEKQVYPNEPTYKCEDLLCDLQELRDNLERAVVSIKNAK